MTTTATGPETAPSAAAAPRLGFYPDIPFDEYVAIPALNGSSLLHLRRSPMQYRYHLDHPTPPTDAMILGTAAHRMILEPDKPGNIAVWGTDPDQKVRRGVVWEAFKAANADKMIVTKAECEAMIGMTVASHKCAPLMRYAGAKGQNELSMVWRDPVSGRIFKGRIDKLIPGGAHDTIFDLKTTRSCQKFKFGNQAYQLGYYIKMALYANGYKALTGKDAKVVLGAIESTPPYESAVYHCTSDTILQGLEDLDKILKTLAECEEKNIWPAAEVEETELVLPSYAYPQEDDDLSDLALEE